jgi:drug/metabolite transporter (DMT)-like permease
VSVAEPVEALVAQQGGPRTPSHWRAELGLASICLVWGATFVVVKGALADVSTLLFLGLRFTLATLVLLCIFLYRRGIRTALRKGPVFGGLLAGVCLFGGYFLQTEGLKYTTPGKCGFITGLYIVLVPLFSAALHRRLPDRFEMLGVGLATAGMGLMAIDGESLRINIGDLLTMGCAVLYAVHILVLGRFSPTMSVERLTLLQLGTCAVLGLAASPFAEQVYFRQTSSAWSAIVITAVLATALAFTVQTWGQKYTTPTRTALIFALEPVFALATSYAVGAEALTARSVSGAACILGGILAVELKPVK